MPQIQFPDFMAVTFGLVTYLIGEAINKRVGDPAPLQHPRSGDRRPAGRAAVLRCSTRPASSRSASTPTPATCCSWSSSPASGSTPGSATCCAAAGRSAILVVITTGLLLVQNLVGALGAWIAGLPLGMAVVLGSTSLLGGHGTIIAWSPELAARGLAGAPEIGIAMATLGLVVACVIGGPIGRFLIEAAGLALRRARRGQPGRPLRHRAAARADHPQRADAHAADGLFLHHPRLPRAARGARLRGDAAALRALPARRPRRRQPARRSSRS